MRINKEEKVIESVDGKYYKFIHHKEVRGVWIMLSDIPLKEVNDLVEKGKLILIPEEEREISGQGFKEYAVVLEGN